MANFAVNFAADFEFHQRMAAPYTHTKLHTVQCTPVVVSDMCGSTGQIIQYTNIFSNA